MELYLERGFESTTVADIAQRAGLTARTFFRYFSDKREVLFAGSAALSEAMVGALEACPPSATSIEAVGAALQAAATVIGANHEFARQRHAVIAANEELQERELMKMAALAAALTSGLRRRGVHDPDASLVAEAGIAVLRVAFERWVTDPASGDLAEVLRQSMQRLVALTADSR
jgi:AcrR family transcriptional regulator